MRDEEEKEFRQTIIDDIKSSSNAINKSFDSEIALHVMGRMDNAVYLIE